MAQYQHVIAGSGLIGGFLGGTPAAVFAHGALRRELPRGFGTGGDDLTRRLAAYECAAGRL